jgi:hypothetical protein
MRNLAAKAVRTRQVKTPTPADRSTRRCTALFSIFCLYAVASWAFSNLYAVPRTFLTSTASQGDRVMSLHLVAGIDFPSQLPTATAPYFLLGQNLAGAWVIRETTGRRAGLFRTREAAIKFARDESPTGNFTILHQPEGLELEERRHVSRAA